MDKTEVNMSDVSVGETKDEGLTDLQIYGISGTVVTLLGMIKKYSILAQIQKEILHKPPQSQHIMREIYQFEETKMIMDIRTQFDMVYVYTLDKTIVTNFQTLRDSFEQSVLFLTSNIQTVDSFADKNYIEILDEFADKLQALADTIATKSIYEAGFKLD